MSAKSGKSEKSGDLDFLKNVREKSGKFLKLLDNQQEIRGKDLISSMIYFHSRTVLEVIFVDIYISIIFLVIKKLVLVHSD